MNLTLDKKGTLYDQIARASRLGILEGRLVAGNKLPPSHAQRVAALAVNQSHATQVPVELASCNQSRERVLIDTRLLFRKPK
jgi:hypothetical protein